MSNDVAVALTVATLAISQAQLETSCPVALLGGGLRPAQRDRSSAWQGK